MAKTKKNKKADPGAQYVIEPPNFVLIPRAVKDQREAQRTLTKGLKFIMATLAATLLLIAAAGAWNFYNGLELSKAEDAKAKAQAEYNELRPVERYYSLYQKQEELAYKSIQTEVDVPIVVRSINNSTPPGLRIESLSQVPWKRCLGPEESIEQAPAIGCVQLQGTADSAVLVTELLTNLDSREINVGGSNAIVLVSPRLQNINRNPNGDIVTYAVTVNYTEAALTRVTSPEQYNDMLDPDKKDRAPIEMPNTPIEGAVR